MPSALANAESRESLPWCPHLLRIARQSLDCIGTFTRPQTTIVVGQDSDWQLILTVGGQPTYKLLPYQSRTFVIAELTGFRVEFRRGAE